MNNKRPLVNFLECKSVAWKSAYSRGATGCTVQVSRTRLQRHIGVSSNYRECNVFIQRCFYHNLRVMNERSLFMVTEWNEIKRGTINTLGDIKRCNANRFA